MNIIKGFIKKLFGSWSNIKWIGYGDTPDNAMVGELYQHYGFKSFPPESTAENPRVRSIIVKKGNNVWSVAERDIGFENTLSGFEPGNTVIYADNHMYIIGPDVNIFLTTGGTTNTVLVDNAGGTVNIKSGSNVNVQAPASSTTYYLVTSQFLQDFCNHTHTCAAPGSPSLGVLNLTGVGTVTPIMLNGDLTKTLKGD